MFEGQYAEIGEGLETDDLNTPASQDDGGTEFFSEFFNNLHYSDTMNGDFVDNMTETLEISVDCSNFYLKPIFVPRKPIRLEKGKKTCILMWNKSSGIEDKIY